MNRDTELAISTEIARTLEIVEQQLRFVATADVTKPCNVSVTVTVERSSYDLKKTQIAARVQTTVKHVEPEAK